MSPCVTKQKVWLKMWLMDAIILILAVIAGIGAITGTVSIALEVKRRLYEVLTKASWVAFGVAGILRGI